MHTPKHIRPALVNGVLQWMLRPVYNLAYFIQRLIARRIRAGVDFHNAGYEVQTTLTVVTILGRQGHFHTWSTSKYLGSPFRRLLRAGIQFPMLCESSMPPATAQNRPFYINFDPDAAGRLFEYRPALVNGVLQCGCCDQFTTLLTGSRDSYVGSEPQHGIIIKVIGF